MKERILGYVLLVMGMLTMAFSVYFIYLTISNNITPFEVFQENETDKPQVETVSKEQLSDPRIIASMQKEIITEVLDSQINKTMNLGTTLVFGYFLMLFGFRISSLGVQLMRPIEVKLNASKPPTESSEKDSPTKLS